MLGTMCSVGACIMTPNSPVFQIIPQRSFQTMQTNGSWELLALKQNSQVGQ